MSRSPRSLSFRMRTSGMPATRLRRSPFRYPIADGAAVDFHLRHDRRRRPGSTAEHVVDHLLDQRMVDLVEVDVIGRAAQFEIALRR